MSQNVRTHGAFVWLFSVGLVAWPAGAQIPSLTLNPDQSCYAPGDPVVVDIDMSVSATAICAAQLFLVYDASKLAFVSMTPSGEGPFTFELFESIDEKQGLITYAVAQLPTCSDATQGPATIAVLTFEAIDVCIPFLDFMPHDPPTLLSGESADVVEPVLIDMEPIKIDDGTVPVVVCPAPVVVCADAATQSGVATWAPLTDGCAFPVDATCDFASGGSFPMGTTTVTCDATEFCGLMDTCMFDVIVVDAIADTGPGDSNGDLVVDLADFADFVGCSGGPGLPPPPDPTMCVDACLSAFDADLDGDVDLLDFRAFQLVFSVP